MSNTNKERVVQVQVQPNPYPVIIGADQLLTLGRRLAERFKARRAAVITDENVGPLYGAQVISSLQESGFESTLLTVPAGDATKSLEQVSRLYDALAKAKIDRSSPVVALGGGMVGDLAGFSAATWLRGVPFIQCPTTVLADVDASVGGKTGVNHPAGKNLIGSFYQPTFVLIDTTTLKTLSPRDFRAGLVESIKHAVIKDADFFEWHEKNADSVLAYGPEALGTLFERNVGIKAEVVAQDEREVSGQRALLNFGHTIGHAIETAMARGPDPWRHGECVAVGMVAACEMSVLAGRLDRKSAERVADLLQRVGLPLQAPLGDAREDILRIMRADKKVAAGKLRFVLAQAIGEAFLCADIKEAWITAALDRVIE